jgi:hypothetical protein
LTPEGAAQFESLEFAIRDAAAFAGALDSGDPVVAMTTLREISPVLVQAFVHKTEDRAYILPVLVRGRPAGLVYASGGVEMAPLELLAQATVLALESRIMPAPQAPAGNKELVTIQGIDPSPQGKVPSSWSDLTPPDQELHLRAQRFARVHVAGMRLYSPELVKRARAGKDVYGALQKDIDNGRDMFRQMFLSASPTMVDYFHLELLRTLASENAALLGEKYPGPMV